MTKRFLAIGSAHWDILGRAFVPMNIHDDVGGHIHRIIGGVAGPIAMKLGKLGATVECICYVGRDEFGDALLRKLEDYHVGTSHALQGDLPTDVYMGIEAPNGLIAAIADCHSLERFSAQAVEKLLAHCDPHTHLVVDGNLHEEALYTLAQSKFPCAQLTLVPASPGKVGRFAHFIGRQPAQLIVNLREANLLLGENHKTSESAAAALLRLGFSQALVSNSSDPATYADQTTSISKKPSPVTVKRFTGAGDTLAAHFLYAQSLAMPPQKALETALEATSEFISQEALDV